MNFLRFLGTLQRKSCVTLRIPSAKYATHQPLHPRKFSEVEDSWKEKDGVSKQWKLIYKAPMHNILNYTATYLTVSTALVTCTGIYYGLFVFDKNSNQPIMLGENVVLAETPAEALIYVFAFCILHLAVKVLLSKYVIRLYQDGDKYLAIFRGPLYNSIVKHEFSLEEFEKLTPTFVVSWGDARFSLGKKHGILLENYFKTPHHFNCLLYKKKNEEISD